MTLGDLSPKMIEGKLIKCRCMDSSFMASFSEEEEINFPFN